MGRRGVVLLECVRQNPSYDRCTIHYNEDSLEARPIDKVLENEACKRKVGPLTQNVRRPYARSYPGTLLAAHFCDQTNAHEANPAGFDDRVTITQGATWEDLAQQFY